MYKRRGNSSFWVFKEYYEKKEEEQKNDNNLNNNDSNQELIKKENAISKEYELLSPRDDIDIKTIEALDFLLIMMKQKYCNNRELFIRKV